MMIRQFFWGMLNKGIAFVLFVYLLFGVSTNSAAEILFRDREDYSKAIMEAENRLREDLVKGDSSQIEKLIRENPNNAEIHQGIAELLDYSGYEYTDTAISEYRKAISIAPKAEHLRTGLIAMYFFSSDYYNTLKFKEEDKEKILNTLMKECNEAEKLWPKNAFYNYVKAYVYLEQDEKEKADTEIQKALKKPYMHQYRATILTSRDKVLTLLDFPLREKIAINQTFVANYFKPMGACAKYLITKGEELQKNGKFEEAIELYNDSIKIYRQLEESDLLGDVWRYGLRKIYSKIYECYRGPGLQSEAEAIQKEISRIEEETTKHMQQVEKFYKFMTTADEKEIEEKYQQMLKQGYIMK